VRHAAGETAERLEALRSAQIGLSFAERALGMETHRDVRQEGGQRDGAVRSAHGAEATRIPGVLAVRGDGELHVAHRAIAPDGGNRFVEFWAPGGRNDVAEAPTHERARLGRVKAAIRRLNHAVFGQ
jgi:hypothetical protein